MHNVMCFGSYDHTEHRNCYYLIRHYYHRLLYQPALLLMTLSVYISCAFLTLEQTAVFSYFMREQLKLQNSHISVQG